MIGLPNGVRRAFRLAVNRPRIDEEVDDEVEFHLAMRAAELVARGWSREAARAEAQRRFGDPHLWREAMSTVDRERAALDRRAEWTDNLRQDLSFAVRSLRRAPLFTMLAVVTLALGIGANAAVFGVLKSVLLDSLPYSDADRLVRAYGHMVDGSVRQMPLSAGTITTIRERQRSFSSLAAFVGLPREVVYATDAGPSLVKVGFVEPALFQTLGVPAARGRALREEDAASDTSFNVIVTHGTWQRVFGGDPDVLGRSLTMNNISRTVVGILPADFVGPIGEVDFYFPISLRASLRDPVSARMRMNFGLIGRLAPGATVAAADREVAAIVADIGREYPTELGSFAAGMVSLRMDMAGDTRTPLLVLMASAVLVLLITCANLAGAFLSRTISRRKEFAVRAALGAGRGRLVRQVLTESTLLAVIGGVVGVALAIVGLRLLSGLASTVLPPYADLSLDLPVLVGAGLLALLTGIAFGAAPAVGIARSNPQGALVEESRSASESRRSGHLRGLLVAGQIALSVSLLAGAALLTRSLWAMTSASLGFNPDGVLAVTVYLPQQQYGSGEARERFMRQFEQRLASLPGVTIAASTSEPPTRFRNKSGFTVEGAPPLATDARPLAIYSDVSDDYFRTLSIPLRAGRFFTEEERLGGPLSLIVTEGMVKRYWPNGDAVGSRVLLGPPGSDAPTLTVVGVVGDVRNDPARAEAEPVLYLSNRQMPWNGPVFLVRTAGDPQALVQPVRRALAEMDPGVPMQNATTLRALLSDGFAGRRLPVVLMTAFGALALLLASVGVYAMFGAMALAREREFGVRVALGSSRGAIAWLVVRQGAVWMALGIAAGVLGIIAISRAVRSLLYGVSPFDPVALGAALVVLVLCGTAALLVPVWRATRADPISILR